MKKMGRGVFASVVLCAVFLCFVVPIQTAQAFSVDESGPIGKKWVKLGTEAVVGAPTSSIITTADGKGQYQTFDNGVIIYSADWGAMLVSPAIFQKWLSLKDQITVEGANLHQYVGYPTRDYAHSLSFEAGYFERGMIVVRAADNIARLVYGRIYEHYWNVSDALGLPAAEETAASGGGRYQAFQNGDIFWQSGIGAFAVQGAIRQRWLALNGAGGSLGYPLSDEQDVRQNGVTIGRSNRFENGVIYYSAANGAWEVIGDIRKAYEEQYGGPAGWLGFPTSGQGSTPNSGGVYNNFQQGVIVYHSAGTYKGIWAFNTLDLYVQRLQGDGDDCYQGICGSQDLYVKIHVDTPGRIIDVRRPSSDTYDGGKDIKETFHLTPGSVVQSNLVITITMEAWDDDPVGDNDYLGTVSTTYSIDNLWGSFDSGAHYAEGTGSNSFTATFSIKKPYPFDMTDFRGQLFWSFPNFSTPSLTYGQFASTFTDVDTDEAVWRHPFNALYYELAYQGIAKDGNCFGMCLESVFAQANQSMYSEPVFQFWPDTQDGSPLNPGSPGHQSTINEINIKQGYQLGAESIDWTLGRFLSGNTHDPKQCFNDSRAVFEQGNYPVISVTDSYLGGRGHAVRPYRWDDSNPSKWIMYIANPNNPTALNGNGDDPCRIEIDTASNTFTYIHGSEDVWSGSTWTGGRMLYTPFSVLSSQPRTPFWEVLAMIRAGMLLLVGDAGQTAQITDGQGRTFYEPNLSGSPTRWDEIRQDSQARVPNFARIPLTDAGAGKMPIELYYGHETGATYTHEVLPAPNVPAGTRYEWVMQSGTLSARLLIPGTPGVADQITTKEVGTEAKAVTITIPSSGESKQISWTMSGPVKHRWIELTDLHMNPGQSITMRLVNSGQEAMFENTGQATTADLRVQSGQGATPVVVGTITIENGTTTNFQFDTPLTTLTYTGGTPGNNGWLMSPITITLAAKDYSGTAIHSIEYSKDGVSWTRYTGPFLYADEGVTTLYYRSRDNAGNQEAAQKQTFKIDTRPPEVTALTDKPIYTRVEPVTIHYGASDPTPGSGLASLGGMLNGTESISNGQILDFIWRDLGSYQLTVTATDNAGWATKRTVNFDLVATVGSLRPTIMRLQNLGEIDNNGIVQSLLAKADGAAAAQQRGHEQVALEKLDALLREIAAQQGKHISERAAQLLIGDIRATQQ